MKVILIDPCTRVDISAAKDHGEVITLFDKGKPRPSIWDAAFVVSCLLRLKEIGFDPYIDAILVAGATVPVIKLVARLTAKYPSIQILCHLSPDRGYILQKVGKDV